MEGTSQFRAPGDRPVGGRDFALDNRYIKLIIFIETMKKDYRYAEPNLDQLRALETVVALASFTGAARQLNLSQSAVSVQIRELEDRLGVRLVERLGKKAYATAAGREVLEHARRISVETDAIATAMRRLRDGWIGRVHIGSTLTGLMYLLPPVLKKLHAAHPGIDLLMTNSPTNRMVEAVSCNEMDIGLVTLPVDDSRLAIMPLRVEPMVAILPAATRKVPKEITPDYVATQFLCSKPAPSAISSCAGCRPTARACRKRRHA